MDRKDQLFVINEVFIYIYYSYKQYQKIIIFFHILEGIWLYIILLYQIKFDQITKCIFTPIQ